VKNKILTESSIYGLSLTYIANKLKDIANDLDYNIDSDENFYSDDLRSYADFIERFADVTERRMDEIDKYING
jgi:hypothetical protein